MLLLYLISFAAFSCFYLSPPQLLKLELSYLEQPELTPEYLYYVNTRIGIFIGCAMLLHTLLLIGTSNSNSLERQLEYSNDSTYDGETESESTTLEYFSRSASVSDNSGSKSGSSISGSKSGSSISGSKSNSNSSSSSSSSSTSEPNDNEQ